MIFRFLTGVDNAPARALAESHGIGLMLQPGSYAPSKCELYPVHAVDNGCFVPPGVVREWDEAKWWRYLDRCPRERCMFATAPDVPYDWEASWVRSERYVDRIRGMGFRVGLAMQNGARVETVPWDALDVVFVGGDDAWKLGTRSLEICHAAQARGVPVHMGRAQTFPRFLRATEMLVDSSDGTFLKYGPPQVMADRLAAALDRLYALDGYQVALA